MRSIFTLSLFLIFFNLPACSPATHPGSLAQQSAFLNLKSRYPVIAASGSNQYLGMVAQRLADSLPANTRQLDPKIFIVRTNDPLAVAGPTGEILLSTRFLGSIETESQLIFVLSHELAHSVLDHSSQSTTNNAERDASYRHKAELEADEFAVSVMVVAGYDPRHATRALAFVYRLQGIEPDLQTHPDFAERVYAIESAITSSNWLPPGIESSRSFYEFKQSIPRS